MPPTHVVTPSAQARLLVGAAIGLVGGYTTTFFATIGQFIKPITEEFGWGRAEISAVVVLSSIGSAVAGPPVGRLVQRYGARPVVVVSGAALALAFLAFSVAPANVGYFALLALVTGVLAIGTTPVALLASVPRFFDRRLGLAFGALMGGSAVGAAILQVSVGSALVNSGWRSTYLLLAGIVVVLVGVCALIGFPPGTGPQSRVATVSGEGLTVREAVRWSRFRLLLGALFLSAIGTAGLTIHFVPFVIDQGISPESAAGAAAAAGFGVALGRFVSGALLDRMRATVLTGIVFCIAAVGLAAPGIAPPSPVVFYALCALTGGFALGAEGDIIPFLIRRYTGMLAYPPVLGIAIGSYTLGGAFGTIMFGLSFDVLDSYDPALIAAAAAMVLAAVLVQFMGAYRYPDMRRAPDPSVASAR